MTTLTTPPEPPGRCTAAAVPLDMGGYEAREGMSPWSP